MIAGELALNHPVSLSRWQFVRALLIGALFAAALGLILTFETLQGPVPFIAGQVSPKTILAPVRITFASQLETADARAKAEAQVQDVYDPANAELDREQVRLATRVFDHLDSVRHDPFTTLDQKLEWVQSIPTLTLPALTLSRTLALDEPTFHQMVNETLIVLDVTMRDEIRQTDLPSEYAKIPSRVSLALNADQADLVSQWTRLFVVPNSSFNAQKTSELRAAARERVGTVYHTIEQGEAIVREGEVITPLAVESLEALGIMRARPTPLDIIGPALFAILLVLILAVYLIRLRPALFMHTRALLLVACVFLVFAAGAKLTAATQPVFLYLYPVSASVMLLAVLIDPVVALGVALPLALLMGFVTHSSLEFVSYALVGSLVAALTLGRIERLPAFLWTGVYVALANAAVIGTFRVVSHDADFVTWGQQLLAAMGNGALAGLFAIGSLFVLGKLFGITTSLELIDLARPTHPLLLKLLSDAPGTYHHSLVVGQLAEHAAQRIGADPLLVRVGAYYHDVGKTREPQMFIENQLDGRNVHDELEPHQSAEIVIGHISSGLELAKKHRLPKRLVEFIPQHHGTTLAAYFHRMALKTNGNNSTNEQDFRYPGPKPQSREAAILMLADGIEATTRAERPATQEAIRAIINRITDERLRDGQLDDSDVTLRDLQRIKDAFFDVMQGLYHSRVIYPEPPAAPESTSTEAKPQA
ncbi:MAG: HDIG domain-containing protein [Chloroflexi bacterium]|nr:HDIG domain-containing protein [Chloroflexota bacterium]